MARHHLVPQMYLRNFANDDDQLAMVDRHDLTNRRLVTVNNACNEAGFYSIPTEDLEPQARDGHDPEIVEKALATIEGNTKPHVVAIVTTGALPALEDRARYQIAQYAALQMTRTWGFRRSFVEVANAGAIEYVRARATDDELRKYLARRGKPTRPSDIADFRARLFGPDGPKLRVPEALTTQAAVQFAREEGEYRLFARNWHLRIFDDPVLLTSDAPVAMRIAGPAGTPVPGIATAEVIYWPLDRRHLLAFETPTQPQHDPADRVTEHASPTRATLANKLVAAEAERWIFHHPEDEPLNGFVLPPRPNLVQESVNVVTSDEEVRVTKRLIRRQQ